MPRKILLLEPNYKNKYPPIGLMKLSTYHKMQNDEVEFFKGNLKDLSLRIKLEACLIDLNKVDGRVSWDKRKSIIKSYLATKRNKYIDYLTIEGCLNNSLKKVIEVLKFHSNHTPKDWWDRIYVATLFTFYWDITIKTIDFAKDLVADSRHVYVGGVMATLLHDEIFKETGIKCFKGLLDTPGILDAGNELMIDELPLDYSILDEIDYIYPTQSAYFTYMTKGCTRKCAFCSVPRLEPVYKDKIESKRKFDIVNNSFGEQRNLLLMDNNVLASPRFPEIIQEIKEMGFYRGAKFEQPNLLKLAVENIEKGINIKANLRKSLLLIQAIEKRLKGSELTYYSSILQNYNLDFFDNFDEHNVLQAYKELQGIYEKYRPKGKVERYVDFNQGTDARYVTEENMELMSSIPIKPLRIAFDHVGIKNTYIKAVELAAKYGIKDLSNYILYNFHDKPQDLYERLRINVELGKRLNVKIFSFPMKYIPLFGEDAKHRRYIGTHWNRKFIRAVQSILNATKGIVAPGYNFFYMAFGETLESFIELLWMPEVYIINRTFFENNGITNNWREDFNSLDQLEKIKAKEIIKENDFANINALTNNNNILRLLCHYLHLKEDKVTVSKEVKALRDKYNRLIKKDVFIDLTLTHDFERNREK